MCVSRQGFLSRNGYISFHTPSNLSRSTNDGSAGCGGKVWANDLLCGIDVRKESSVSKSATIVYLAD